MSFFNSQEPLGLPPGSVRAFLALGIVAATVYAVFSAHVEATGLLGLAGMAFAFYFKSREGENGDGK